MLAVVIAFIAVIGGFKYFQIKKAMAQDVVPAAARGGDDGRGAKPEEWNATLKAIGTVAAVQGVTVSADLPGVVEQIDFDSGRPVSKGRRAGRARHASRSGRSSRRRRRRASSTGLNLERMRGMIAAKIVPQATLRQPRRGSSSQAEANVRRSQRHDRAQDHPRSVRRRPRHPRRSTSGNTSPAARRSFRCNRCGRCTSTSACRSRRSRRSRGRIGHRSVSTPAARRRRGKVTAFGSVIDEATRNGQVQASFANRDGKLRPGMFVDAHLAHGAKTAGRSRSRRRRSAMRRSATRSSSSRT